MQMDILVFHGTNRGYEASCGCPEFDYASDIIYIKVTQGKTYTFSWYGTGDDYDAHVFYSKSINSQSYDYDLTY